MFQIGSHLLLRPILAYVTTVVKDTYFTSASRAQPVRILLQSTHPDRALPQDLLPVGTEVPPQVHTINQYPR